MANGAKKDPTEALARTFGERVRVARESLSLTQVQLAARLGVSQPEVASYERGDRLVQIGTLVALADKLATSTDWLLGRVGGPHDPRPPRQPGRVL